MQNRFVTHIKLLFPTFYNLIKGDNFLWHDDIAKHLNGFENEAAVRIAGSRFSVLTGELFCIIWNLLMA
jgi:seryl-tRNA synthetase